MKISHLFTGKPYHEIEMDADALFQMGEYGSAKLEYERALHKSAKKAPEAQDQLETKIVKCRNALALEHLKSAVSRMEAGLHEEAEDLLQLALELVRDEQLTIKIEEQLKQLKTHPMVFETSRTAVPGEHPEESEESAYQESEAEYFAALINTLTEEEQEIYFSYQDPFREGYVKLNQGYFEEAVTLLSQALENQRFINGFYRARTGQRPFESWQ